MPEHLTDGWLVTQIQVMTLGAVRQQAITWTNVDQVLWIHMVSLGQNESIRNGYFWDEYTWDVKLHFKEKWPICLGITINHIM